MKRYASEIRAFNRFYTAHLGLLNDKLLQSEYSLTEARMLFEVGEDPQVTTRELADTLGLDKGYLSRILTSLTNKGLVKKKTSAGDKRAQSLQLTTRGEQALAVLQSRSDTQIVQMTSNLGPEEIESLLHAMSTVRLLLGTGYNKDKLAAAVSYRDKLKPGDLGFMIYLHGKLYAEESGYSLEFEGYVAKTFYEFVESHDPELDRIWFAEYHGEVVASVAILKRPRKMAQLRWFLVHPMFRGTGIGRNLLQLALTYAQTKFKGVYLMTADTQRKAIEMYRRAGFMLTRSARAEQWGTSLREERYDLMFKEV